MTCFLVSYRPLVSTRYGRAAASKYQLPAFIDGSCRREPDFESPRPSISALCRGQMFAPRLRVGDEIVYITTKSNFGEHEEPHHRLVAHLRVIDLSDTHEDAGRWYVERGFVVPSNCLIPGNSPRPYDQTMGFGHRRNISERNKLRLWDEGYQDRARQIGRVAHCETLSLELNHPPKLYAADFQAAFGRIPATRTPPAILCVELRQLTQLAR